MELIPVLIDLRSVHNVGSIFRTADGAGCREIVLVGYTPSPYDKFGNVRKDFQKVALGAEDSFSVVRYTTPGRAIAALRKRGFFIVALEQNENSILFTEFSKKYGNQEKVALLMGSEVEGLPRSVCEKSDALVEIPMRGSTVQQACHPRHTKRGKESLNVSVAFGIAVYELFK